jgi:transcriptional regulator with XRE-family HTH domain
VPSWALAIADKALACQRISERADLPRLTIRHHNLRLDRVPSQQRLAHGVHLVIMGAIGEGGAFAGSFIRRRWALSSRTRRATPRAPSPATSHDRRDKAMIVALMPSMRLPEVCRPASRAECCNNGPLGDHIRRQRLGLKMLQREVAELIDVNKATVENWEANASQPDFRFLPAVIQFLGYNPLPPAKTMAEQLVRHRTTLGLSQQDSAERLGVDPGTLAKWERGEREPAISFQTRIERFLDEPEAQRSKSLRVG